MKNLLFGLCLLSTTAAFSHVSVSSSGPDESLKVLKGFWVSVVVVEVSGILGGFSHDNYQQAVDVYNHQTRQ